MGFSEPHLATLSQPGHTHRYNDPILESGLRYSDSLPVLSAPPEWKEGLMGTIPRREAEKLLPVTSTGLLVPRQALLEVEYIDPVICGVQVSAQSYSFRHRPLDAVIETESATSTVVIRDRVDASGQGLLKTRELPLPGN